MGRQAKQLKFTGKYRRLTWNKEDEAG